MYQISNKVDFYITNVCNLTCDRCNRFNNYDFKGWQRWSDYQEAYSRWSKLVELRAITIMGGEPFLNPTLADWIQGLNELFEIEVQVLTNGTRFRYAKNVYPTLLYESEKTGAMNHIGVSLHNINELDQLREDILSFLQGPVEEYTKETSPGKWFSDWQFIDSNGVIVNVYRTDVFGAAAIRSTMPKQYMLHNNDPVRAHENCAFARFKSYHFIKGQLYKCGPVALMPEFDQQHTLEISEEDRKLLNSYRPLTPDNFEEYSQSFFENLDNPIPQCKFCPVEYDAQPIFPLRKGTLPN